MKFFRSRFFRIIVIVVCLMLIISLSRASYSLWKKKDIIVERQQELQKLEREQKDLKEKLVDVHSSSFIEQIAREKLGMIKEGEKIVLLPTSDGDVGDVSEFQKDEPNWKKWFGLFF